MFIPSPCGVRWITCGFVEGIVDIEEALMSPTQDSESSKPAKREGNGNSDQTVPTHAKTSRRTTSLLNLFMSNSQGTCQFPGRCSTINPGKGCVFRITREPSRPMQRAFEPYEPRRGPTADSTPPPWIKV